MRQRNKKSFPRYFVFKEDELLFLIICAVLDISEYVIAILLLPKVGDFLDIVGIVSSIVMFRWIGIVSFLELVPGLDILPIFIVTWLTWYLTKPGKRKKNKNVPRKRAE